MIPARVIAVDKSTGKIYQAMRSEMLAASTTWDWTEVSYRSDVPYIGGDVVFEFATLADFPHTPPSRNKITVEERG